MVVLVTGASGQLGQAIQSIAHQYPEIAFHFAGSAQADVTNLQQLSGIFDRLQPDYCINAAAYTAVDKAETEPEQARLINVVGAKNLATACHDYGTVLIHISTDFVFDGNKTTPYSETDDTDPQSIYGLTKRDGERQIVSVLKAHFIIRTSWIYSQFGHNFMKTMLRLARERDSLNVVNDQTGTPTNAVDLAQAIVHIMATASKAYGIYHFSSEGETTWYGFAKKIFEYNQIAIALHPIPTAAFPTPAKRPAYSVLDKSKFKRTFGIHISDWQTALEKE